VLGVVFRYCKVLFLLRCMCVEHALIHQLLVLSHNVHCLARTKKNASMERSVILVSFCYMSLCCLYSFHVLTVSCHIMQSVLLR